MQLLYQLFTSYHYTPVVVATAAPVSEFASLIADFGIQIVIVAMMMFFMWKYMNNLIKRDNKLYEEIIPRLTTIEKSIKEMDTSVSQLISNHNAHTNQSIKAMEKDLDDIRDMTLRDQDQLRNISGQLTVLEGNIEVLFHNIIALSANNSSMIRMNRSYENSPIVINSDTEQNDDEK